MFKLPNGIEVGTGLLATPPLMKVSFRSYPEIDLLDDAQIKRLLTDRVSRYKFMREVMAKWMINQGSVGKCNASAAVGSMYQARWKQGFKHVPLSDNYLYMNINGGKDAGSMLDDGMRFASKKGVAPTTLQSGPDGTNLAVIPQEAYNSRRLPQTTLRLANLQASRFITHEPFVVSKDYDTFKQTIATALALDLPVVMAWDVTQASMRLRNGYIQSGKGPGNHASLFQSAKWVGGDDIVHPDLRNSWGPTRSHIYGPQDASWGDGGFGLMTMEQAFRCRNYHDFYVIPSCKIDDWYSVI